MGTYEEKSKELHDKKLEFIENKGWGCMNCDEDDSVEWETPALDSESIEINVYCDACGASWTNIYTIRDVENLEVE